MMSTKTVKDLQVGDRVVMGDGEVKTIKAITNGFYYGSKLLGFGGEDWACEENGVEVEVREKD